MIKQFNFYDIYGYLLPGTILFALLWMPIGVLTNDWPDQDLSKALFLTALAYVAGHLVQTIANSVVPSTIPDSAGNRRFPSELLLDQSDTRFTDEFKTQLAGHVLSRFGLDMKVTMDGTGKNDISGNRQIAFFQARSYLIAKKAAQYAEQFEGLYVMMRGLGCAFCVGAAYLTGWALSLRRGNWSGLGAIPWLVWAGISLALISALVALFSETAKKWANRCLIVFLLLALAGSGFLVGTWRIQPVANATGFPNNAETILWGATLIALISAVRCFGAYKGFAMNFAETIWRDFCADLSISASDSNDPGNEDDDD